MNLKLLGTAKAFILFGFAFDAITAIRGENVRMRGMFRGKKSLGLLSFATGAMDKAACTGATNSQRSMVPFHGFTLTVLAELGGEYLVDSKRTGEKTSQIFPISKVVVLTMPSL